MSELGIAQLHKMIKVTDNEEDDSKGDDAIGLKDNESLLEYMYERFGGFTAAVGATKTALTASQMFFKNNEKYQKSVGFLNGIIPSLMTVHELYKRIKEYIDNQKYNNTPHIDEELIFVAHIFDVEENNIIREYSPEVATQEILKWIVEGNTNIVECIVDKKWNMVEEIPENTSWAHYFFINIEGLRFVLFITYNPVFETYRVIRGLYSGLTRQAISMGLAYTYINSLNYRENLIVIDYNNKSNKTCIQTVPRQTIDHPVYQLNDDFFTEIKKSIEKRKKRGYAFVGQPGVGKTTIINKMIDELRDIPIIVVPADSTKTPTDIMKALIISQMVAPCMVIIEDIDMLPMQFKDSTHLSTFIEYLDSAKYDAPVIFVATLNEPELIHESLMDRRGRFDKVIVIPTPSTSEEVQEVMKNVYTREIGGDMPEVLCDEFYKIAFSNKLRHSDFTEILNRMLINDLDFTRENLLIVIKDLCNTQNIVNEFKKRKSGGKSYSKTQLEQEVIDDPTITIKELLDSDESFDEVKEILYDLSNC